MDVDPNLLVTLKKKYGSIFVMEDMGIEFLCRPMTKADITDLNMLQNYVSSAEVEDEMLRRCVIMPEHYDFNNHSAAFVSFLSAEITDRSGFGDEDRFLELLEEARVDATRVTNTMKALVIAAIPTITLAEFEDMTLKKQIELVALSEKILELHRAQLPHLELLKEDEGGAKSQQPVDPIQQMLAEGMRKAAAEVGMDTGNLVKGK